MTKADIYLDPHHRLPSISFEPFDGPHHSIWTAPTNPHVQIPIQIRNMKTMYAHEDNNTENWINSSSYQKTESAKPLTYDIKMESDIGSEEVATTTNSGESVDGGSGNAGSRSSSPVQSEDGSTSKSVKGGDSKVCGVCGDKALGNNFNAITCESCKAFFRRNAKKNKEFVCPFSNNCKVDPVTRRFCQKCRLKKCFDIGMKKEWIMTDEEKKVKKQKIEQNRLKRQSSDVLIPLNESSAPLPKAACMVADPNSNGSSSSTPATTTNGNAGIIQRISQNSTIQFPVSPPDPTLPHKILKQPMMPHNNYEADRTSEYLTEVQFKENSDSCSSTSSSFPSPSSSQSQQTILPHNSNNNKSRHHHQDIKIIPGSSSSSSTTNGISIFNSPSTINTANILSNPLRNNISTSSDNSNNINNNSFLTFSSSSSSSTSLSTGNNQTHMPLLSSLMRPGTAESPPDYQISSIPVSSPITPVPLPPQQQQHTQPNHHPTFELLNHSQEQVNGGALNRHQNVHPHHETSLPTPPINMHLQQQQQQSQQVVHSHHQMNGTTQGLPCHEQGQDSSDSSYSNEERGNHNNEIKSLSVSEIVNKYVNEEDSRPEPHSMSNANSNFGEEIPLPLNTMDSILSVAISAEFSASPILHCGQSGIQTNSRQLNKAEQSKLNELLVASTALYTPVDMEGPVKKDPSLINVINLTDIAIRRLIKMAKRVNAFKQLCSDDQVALLKGSCTEMMILRSVVSYDPDRDSWTIPHSNLGYNIKMEVLKEARGNLYEEHQRFVKNFKPEWRKDENIMIILCAITLFTAERPNVVHKDVIKLEQDSYYYLLKRYLESIYDGCEARSAYLQLIKKIAELHVLNSNHLRVFLEVNPREVGPLLIEIFDLK